jgi:hypothetical protein
MMQWQRDPDDAGWQICGHPEIGVVRSERDAQLCLQGERRSLEVRWAPAYLETGEPANNTNQYNWSSLADAITAAEQYIAQAETDGSQGMREYRIHSKAGGDFGVWQGETPADALLALHRDAGYGPEVCWVEGELRFRSASERELLGDCGVWSVEEIEGGEWH